MTLKLGKLIFTFIARVVCSKAWGMGGLLIAMVLTSKSLAAEIDTPLNVKAYGGGDSVVIVWPRSAVQNPVYYRVIRNGQPLGFAESVSTDTPVVSYVDKLNLVKGVRYNYQVVAINALTNTHSSPSDNAYVTIPTFEVPVPSIELDYSIDPSTRNYLENLKAALETWYPKINVLLAAPSYKVPEQIGIKVVDEGCTNAMWVQDEKWIYVCVKHARSRSAKFNYQDVNVVVHEGTHLMQSYFSGAPSIDEGIATWAGDLTEQKVRPIPGAEMSFLNGYEYSAAFFSWIMNRYPNSNLVRYLNIQAHDQIIDYNWFAEATGKKVNQLWQEMTQVEMSLPQPFVHGTGLCAQVLGEGDPEIKYGLVSRCANVNSQTFVYEPSAKRLRVEAGCLAVGAQSRARVVGCTEDSVGSWVFESIPQYAGKQWGQWRETKTDTCLQLAYIPRQINDSMPGLIARACDGQSWSQVWRPLVN